MVNDVRTNSDVYDIVALDANNNVIGTLSDNGLVSYGDWGVGIREREDSAVSLYVNDEIAIGDLRVDAGIRWESVSAIARDGNQAAVNQPVPPGVGGLVRTVGPTFDGTFTTRRKTQSKAAYTVGANYLITQNLAIYARYANGFQTNNVDPMTTIELYEVGVRYQYGRIFSGSATVFQTNFDDQNYNFADPVNPSQQTNLNADLRTRGIEFDFLIRPEPKLRNLQLNGVTQSGFEGNRPERTPARLFTITPTVQLPHGLGEVYGRYKHVGRIFADNGNGLALPSYGVTSLGVTLNLSDRLQANFNVDNLFDVVGLTEGNPRQGQTQAITDGFFYARGIVGTTFGGSLTEGQNINAFVRDGRVAAHLLLRNGTDPRILVAFPAGNSGVGLWFAPLAQPATWRIEQAPAPMTLADDKGRPLYAIATTATLDAPSLTVKQAVLSNVRFLRDYQSIAKFPAENRVDGAPGYRLEVEVLAGSLANGTITAPTDGPLRLRIVVASGDTPLTGLAESELLNAKAAADPDARNALRFLSYREKFLAGSWRFNTYFGRDTLMSVRLLMPVLQPAAVEAGLGAVLARLNGAGEVAHEEGLSEFAILERRQHKLPGGDQATLDYAMVDDDYMLAPVAGEFLLGQAGVAEARAFLARKIPSETGAAPAAAGALLVRNLRFVIDQAAPFAAAPSWQKLIAIKDGRMTGEWRDSEEGLGRGRYAYNVNGVFVPAALEAADKLYKAGLLDPYLTPRPCRSRQGRCDGQDLAVAQVREYAARVGVPAEPALAAMQGQTLSFNAISLDASGKPVPIVNSDDGFLLLFGHPSAAELETFVGAAMRPFPAGLMTDVGLLVANAAQATPEVEDRFGPGAYHAAVGTQGPARQHPCGADQGAGLVVARD
ncbi:tonB dependent receptor domain-containing protein [Ditylenchus destructor]|uniref:TonB dependent receptor domain-containing protein n=1 Tax=Ditylenchus destructor TaxID=166010 RepID=A0AAD4QSZ7_9BILA|nr:tonB dependent receptor domain-containing protein [Ditylenchus destructor]